MENQALNKSQLCWIIVRVGAVYLLYSGITSLLPIVAFGSFRGIPSLAGFKPPTNPFLLVILFGMIQIGLGYYLLRNGFRLHNLLMFEKSNFLPPSKGPTKSTASKNSKRPPEPVDPHTLLTKRETEQFTEWLDDHPELATRALEDQIALFRDYLRDNPS